jgi:hypothetical protein
MFDNVYENLVGLRDRLARLVASRASFQLDIEDYEHLLVVIQLVIEAVPRWRPMTEKPVIPEADLQTLGHAWSEPVLALSKQGSRLTGGFIRYRDGASEHDYVFEHASGEELSLDKLAGWVYLSDLDAILRNRPIPLDAQGANVGG